MAEYCLGAFTIKAEDQAYALQTSKDSIVEKSS